MINKLKYFYFFCRYSEWEFAWHKDSQWGYEKFYYDGSYRLIYLGRLSVCIYY